MPRQPSNSAEPADPEPGDAKYIKRSSGIVQCGKALRLQSGLKSDWYRARAAECTSLAKNAPDIQSKMTFEEMAASWLRLAELVERLELGDRPR